MIDDQATAATTEALRAKHHAADDDDRFRGRLHRYDGAKGYGFIVVRGKELHEQFPRGVFANLEDFTSNDAPYPGVAVSFQLGCDRFGRIKAVRIRCE